MQNIRAKIVEAAPYTEGSEAFRASEIEALLNDDRVLMIMHMGDLDEQQSKTLVDTLSRRGPKLLPILLIQGDDPKGVADQLGLTDYVTTDITASAL